jgi:hypothetical protein
MILVVIGSILVELSPWKTVRTLCTGPILVAERVLLI